MARARNLLIFAVALAGCSSSDSAASNAAVCAAAANGASHVEVTASGTVTRVLGVAQGRTDAHEGFLMRVPCGQQLVVRVEANTSFTGTFALAPGSHVDVKGEYETDRRGGVIHWTHRDPRGRHPGGYVRVNGTTFQ